MQKEFVKIFKFKNLLKYHDMYVQTNTLLLADVFENFWNMYLEIYYFDLARFRAAAGLAWQLANLKKGTGKLDLLTDFSNNRIDIRIEEEYIKRNIHRSTKANNKCMKILIKIKNRHILNIGI